MNCMKCGTEIPETQVFCDHCLEVMEQYPVKPDAHVHLPKRAPIEEISKKSSKKKRNLSPEEIIERLKLKVMRMRLMILVLMFILCLLGGYMGLCLYSHYVQPETGRNYTIDVTMGKK